MQRFLSIFFSYVQRIWKAHVEFAIKTRFYLFIFQCILNSFLQRLQLCLIVQACVGTCRQTQTRVDMCNCIRHGILKMQLQQMNHTQEKFKLLMSAMCDAFDDIIKIKNIISKNHMFANTNPNLNSSYLFSLIVICIHSPNLHFGRTRVKAQLLWFQGGERHAVAATELRPSTLPK